jgi:hypothetical protein
VRNVIDIAEWAGRAGLAYSISTLNETRREPHQRPRKLAHKIRVSPDQTLLVLDGQADLERFPVLSCEEVSRM